MTSIIQSTLDEAGKPELQRMKRILVVAQDSAAAINIRGKLLGLGYESLSEASAGEEAVELAARLKPDLVLMDVVLNGSMDGIEAAEQIGKRYRIPVVFLAAFSDDETFRRAKLTEPFGFVTKPFDERELHTVIEMALYRHSMELALRISEQKFFKAFRTSPDSININRLEDGVFLDTNDGFTHITGYARNDVLGRSSLEIDLWVDLRSRRTLVESLKKHGAVENLEADFRMKDGRITTGLISATIIELDGQQCILSITRDISDRKRAESDLRASEERYKEFFEQDLTGYFIATVGGTILDCNRAFARIFGCASVEDAKKANLFDSHRDAEAWSNHHTLLLRAKKLENIEVEARRVDGRPLFLNENLIGMFDDQGEMTHVRGYIIDNTERKMLEQTLVHAQKMDCVGTLASGIAHDFNNVLNNILGFSHQLKKHVADPARVMKYSESIEKSAARGAGLSRQLMSFVRKQNRENSIVNVEEIIDEVIDLASETFPRTIAMRKNVEPILLRVSGDRGELYQALLNLCLNARDAIAERVEPSADHRIMISASGRMAGEQHVPGSPSGQVMEHPFWVEIAVSDTGAGIPEHIRSKVFDPFFTTKEMGKGTGLGLSVVYNIVKSHGGSVTVESEHGKGTTIRVLLPAVAAEPIALESHGEVSLRSANNELILLVDDEELMRDLGREVLEDAGYRVVIATNGQHAIDLYRSAWREISLVVLDFIMPDMNGGQVFAQLKSINPGLRAFFCTGYAEDETIVALIERHGLRAIEKPFKPVRLLELIREMLTAKAPS
ncbi:MAG: response regulator [Ignavibacteriales bacterium]|nr:response regulator [Ignavibacteriales bacterium]